VEQLTLLIDEREKFDGAHLWLVLWKAAKSLEANARHNISDLAMGVSDFAIMELLLHKGPTPVNSIAKKVMLTSGSMTPAIDRLVEKGFVERRDDEKDRRVREVRLTSKGRRVIHKAYDKHQKAMDNAVSSLDESERIALVSLLKKLGKSAEQTDGGGKKED
jgi:MarR family 2-MHQ and catechol resistance regulon transcriptional repressor